MKGKINIRRVIELTIVFVLTVVLMLVVSALVGEFGENLPTNLLLILSEGIIVVPAIIYCLIRKLSLKEDFGFRLIRIPTLLFSILLGFLVMPIASFINILTQFFVPNTMVQASNELMEGSQLVMLFIVGFFGPFCEEFTFRGLLHRGYAKYTTPVLGMIISAVLFGIMHMNINQLCYAMVLGLIFAWVNNCSRSIFSSVTMHIVVNTINTVMLMASTAVLEGAGQDLAQSAEALRSDTQSLAVIAVVYFVIALIAFGLMIPCCMAIKKLEGPNEKDI